MWIVIIQVIAFVLFVAGCFAIGYLSAKDSAFKERQKQRRK